MFWCSFIHILSPLHTIFRIPTNQTTLNRHNARADHFPGSRHPNQAIFLAADLQTIPFSSQQTSSAALFPRSRRLVQTMFHVADLRPDHFPLSRPSDQTMTRPRTSQLTDSHKFAQNDQPPDNPGQIVSLWVGLRGVNRNSSGWTLQRILSTHVRLEVPGLLFRLNLIVVRLVSGFPGLVRASPSLFHSWVALQVFGNDRSSAFSNKFRLQFGIFSSFRRMHFIVASPSPSPSSSSSSSLLSPA